MSPLGGCKKLSADREAKREQLAAASASAAAMAEEAADRVLDEAIDCTASYAHPLEKALGDYDRASADPRKKARLNAPRDALRIACFEKLDRLPASAKETPLGKELAAWRAAASALAPVVGDLSNALAVPPPSGVPLRKEADIRKDLAPLRAKFEATTDLLDARIQTENHARTERTLAALLKKEGRSAAYLQLSIIHVAKELRAAVSAPPAAAARPPGTAEGGEEPARTDVAARPPGTAEGGEEPARTGVAGEDALKKLKDQEKSLLDLARELEGKTPKAALVEGSAPQVFGMRLREFDRAIEALIARGTKKSPFSDAEEALLAAGGATAATVNGSVEQVLASYDSLIDAYNDL